MEPNIKIKGQDELEDLNISHAASPALYPYSLFPGHFPPPILLQYLKWVWQWQECLGRGKGEFNNFVQAFIPLICDLGRPRV